MWIAIYLFDTLGYPNMLFLYTIVVFLHYELVVPTIIHFYLTVADLTGPSRYWKITVN
ncbi:MAG: hypothetical protein ACJAZP_003418 [Psychromonas sp.]|jgi:hypothetical protein